MQPIITMINWYRRAMHWPGQFSILIRRTKKQVSAWTLNMIPQIWEGGQKHTEVIKYSKHVLSINCHWHEKRCRLFMVFHWFATKPLKLNAPTASILIKHGKIHFHMSILFTLRATKMTSDYFDLIIYRIWALFLI